MGSQRGGSLLPGRLDVPASPAGSAGRRGDPAGLSQSLNDTVRAGRLSSSTGTTPPPPPPPGGMPPPSPMHSDRSFSGGIGRAPPPPPGPPGSAGSGGSTRATLRAQQQREQGL